MLSLGGNYDIPSECVWSLWDVTVPSPSDYVCVVSVGGHCDLVMCGFLRGHCDISQ
jgi:hypothetical protein